MCPYDTRECSLTVMLSQKPSEQCLPFTFLQVLFHHDLRYDGKAIIGHPNFDGLRLGLGLSLICNLRICSLQPGGFDIIQKFPHHLYHYGPILLRKITTSYSKIVEDIFVPDVAESESGRTRFKVTVALFGQYSHISYVSALLVDMDCKCNG